MIRKIDYKIYELINLYPYIEDYFQVTVFEENISKFRNKTLKEYVSQIDEEILEDIGITRKYIYDNIFEFIEKMEKLKVKEKNINELKIIGGKSKSGEIESQEIIINKGEIVSILGPTGSGNSQLL